jgi:hypothetical protein
MAELAALSDRELSDIGVPRSQISWVVNYGGHDINRSVDAAASPRC